MQRAVIEANTCWKRASNVNHSIEWQRSHEQLWPGMSRGRCNLPLALIPEPASFTCWKLEAYEAAEALEVRETFAGTEEGK